MHQICRVQIMYGAKHVIHDRSRMIHTKLICLMTVNDFSQIGLLYFHNNKNVANRTLRIQINIWNHNIKYLGCKAVALDCRKFAHNLNLTHLLLRIIVILKAIFHQLNSHFSLCFYMHCTHYNPKSTLSELILQHIAS